MAGASTTCGGAGGDRVHLEDGLAPAVAGTVSRAAGGAAGAESVPVVPGADALSTAVAGKMADWPDETEAIYTAAGQRGAHLAAAADAAIGGINATDGANAGAVEGAEVEDV